MSKFVIMSTVRRPTGGASLALCVDHLHGGRAIEFETYAAARSQADAFNRAAAQRGYAIRYAVEPQYNRHKPRQFGR